MKPFTLVMIIAAALVVLFEYYFMHDSFFTRLLNIQDSAFTKLRNQYAEHGDV